ncbi:MAG: GNAT family N-acetyltransferase [Chitinimonas sp.]|nr:GNAT family N-acetyltransferase [Chitinimonas sp.]
MLVPIDLADALLAAELLQLQRLAYRQEAELIGYPDLPPLKEGLPELMESGETMLGWRVDGELQGAIGFIEDGDGILICRLVVSPAVQRRGVAVQLVNAVLDWVGAQPLRVSTAAANAPALALYAKLGFKPVRTSQTPDGLALVSLLHTG